MSQSTPTERKDPPPGERTPRVDGARRVLLVDDEADVRDAGAALLDDNGFDVAAVASGELAIAWLQAETPDVIVLDLMMPGVSGWDVWDWMQARHLGIPVVIWTSTGLHTGAIGAAPIVPKGRPDDLLAALQSVLA